jgi:hypothetical protein
MTDKMFDNFVREKLNDHQSPVPQGLWDKIERKKDKDPKGGFWFSTTGIWAGLLFIVLCMGGGYYLLKNGETASGKNDEQLSQTAAAKNNGSIASADNNSTAAGNRNGNVTNDNQITDTGKNDSNSDNNTTTINIDTRGKKKENPDTEKATPTFKTEKEAIAYFLKYTKAKKARKVEVHTTMPRNITVETEVSSKRDNAGKNLLSLKGGNKTIKKTDDVNQESGTAVLENNSPPMTAVPQRQLGFAKGNLAVNSRNLNISSKDKFDLSALNIPSIDCPTAGTVRRNDWYVEVYGSPDMAMKTVSAKTNPLYVQKKDSTESTKIGYTAGFRFSKSITDNILLKAGLQYSQINERFDLRTENERRITTVITIRTITTASGLDTTVRDTTSLEQIGYSLRRTYNRYRSVDVPILLSYEFGNQNLKFAVNAGVILNLRSWYSGETLNDSLYVVSLNSKSAPTYKQNIGVGLYAGFSIIKPMDKNFDLFIEPYFRYNLSNMATGSSYTQKFNAAGLSLGIRYKLNRQHH